MQSEVTIKDSKILKQGLEEFIFYFPKNKKYILLFQNLKQPVCKEKWKAVCAFLVNSKWRIIYHKYSVKVTYYLQWIWYFDLSPFFVTGEYGINNLVYTTT